jgi:hypothetical protein
MNPGIQLMLRMEREAEAQRRSYMSYRDDFLYRDDVADEKLLRPAKQDNPIKRIFHSHRRQQRRQQQCECA